MTVEQLVEIWKMLGELAIEYESYTIGDVHVSFVVTAGEKIIFKMSGDAGTIARMNNDD